MSIKRINVKLGNMRKPEDFIVYPASKTDDGTFVIQSDHRIAKIDPTTKTGVLSVYKAKGAYFVHLNKILGAMDIAVPDELLAAVRDAQPKSGDAIGPGVYVA